MSLLYLVLSDVSICYPSLRGKFFTRYSPVRHDTFYRSRSSHRLACVKHSVSVHPEPGSNSSFNLFTPLIFFLKLFDRNCITLFLFSSFWFAFLLILLFCFYCPFVMQNLFRIDKNYITTLYYSLSTTFFTFFVFYFYFTFFYDFVLTSTEINFLFFH